MNPGSPGPASHYWYLIIILDLAAPKYSWSLSVPGRTEHGDYCEDDIGTFEDKSKTKEDTRLELTI